MSVAHGRRALVCTVAAVLFVMAGRAGAHVGSADVFLDAPAGPYRLFVTIRPPYAVPGLAHVEILAADADVRDVTITPLPLSGPGAQFAPAPDAAVQSKDDPRFFSGQLWMMTAGAWQVQVTARGDRGEGVLSVPVPTFPQATRDMGAGLGALLFALLLLLCAGLVSIVGAVAREATRERGQVIGPPDLRRGRIAGATAAAIVTVVVALGNWWWSVEASSYARYVYKPLDATVSAADGRLRLALSDPGWIGLRRLDDVVPDHGYPMHLFVVTPALDRLWHLHPDQVSAGTFEQRLPPMPSGSYELFADVVHASGISETVTARFDAADTSGSPLVGDDSSWSMNRAPAQSDPTVSPLTEGGRMVWLRNSDPLQPARMTLFTFRVDDAAGRPATDLELYMGMPGHAIFVRKDRRVFAHVHPSGSAPMAAMEIGRASLTGSNDSQSATHGRHSVAAALPPVVSFPFGLPEPGAYRIFVQVKRGGRVQTGAFDVSVP